MKRTSSLKCIWQILCLLNKNLHSVLLSVAKKYFIAIFLSCILMYQKREISIPVVQNHATENRKLGMIVTLFQDLKVVDPIVF